MVNTILFQPSLLDCWACRDLKRFRQVLKGGGAFVLTQSQPFDNALANGRGSAGPSSFGKDTNSSNFFSNSQGKSPAQGGQSWGNTTNAFNAPCSPAEVNRRDYHGRTVLHLVSASTEPVSIDYLTALLAHPAINVNLQDHESGWTALHRALYHGNLLTALTLLKRSPSADIRIKDFEGLTPFDLYNSTIHGTNPPKSTTTGDLAGELFLWGANRNFTLGLGTSDDRAFPDKAQLRINEDEENRMKSKQRRRRAGTKFDKIQVKDVGMSKFATVVLTSQPFRNVWVCGIGNTGRIGRAPPTQPNFEVLKDFDETAEAIAVGPEHTMILTTEGDLFTFGFNKFQQLGYALKLDQGIVASSSKGGGGAAQITFGGPSLTNADLDIQISPRKVMGILKKERLIGIAAGKLHSAAFTSETLFTWGSNTGQLGYDRAATPSQIVPRKVTAITSNMSIVSVALTDYATACLLSSGDVLLLHNDTSFFVRFPQLTFSSQTSVYRPRQARPKTSIIKIAAGPNNSIAAISDIGDLWQFTPEHPSEYAQTSGTSTGAKANIKPQLIWSVRKNKKVGAARDVGIGSGQDLIIVTESGHVFVRSRKSDILPQSNNISNTNSSNANNPLSSISVKGKSGWKPVPYLQRIFRVAMNESGGLAAIKMDAKVREVLSRSPNQNDDVDEIGSENEKTGEDIIEDLAETFASELNITDVGVMSFSLTDADEKEGKKVHDVELQLSDCLVQCHSILLRRSPFFAALFQPHWTSNRWTNEGILKVDMSHTRWEVARIPLMFLYTDKTYDLFEDCDLNRQHDEFIDFITEVLAFSNELLIEKMKLVCCEFLRKRILPSNVAALMTDADFYHVPAFKESIMDYSAKTLETLLESGMLDDLENKMIKDLTKFIRQKQDERLHRTRAAQHISNLIALHNDFYFDLDLPLPSLGIIAARVPKRMPRSIESRPLSPTNTAINMHKSSNVQRSLQSNSSPMPSPDLKAWQPGIGNNSTLSASTLTTDSSLMFSMDDEMDDIEGKKQIGKPNEKFSLPPAVISTENDSSPSRSMPWKSQSNEANRSKGKQAQGSPSVSSITQDLRSIMAAERTLSQKSSPSIERRSSQRNIPIIERATSQRSVPLVEGTPPKWSMPSTVGRTTSQRSIPLTESITPQKSMAVADRSGSSWSSPNSTRGFQRQSTGSNGWPGPSSQAWIPSNQQQKQQQKQQQQTMSLADIQAEELKRLKELNANQQRAPKSFADLQEEDRRDNEKRAKEEEERKAFEIWFEEESKRVKEDQNRQKTENDQKKRGNSSNNKNRGGRGGNRGGRGGKKKTEQNGVI